MHISSVFTDAMYYQIAHNMYPTFTIIIEYEESIQEEGGGRDLYTEQRVNFFHVSKQNNQVPKRDNAHAQPQHTNDTKKGEETTTGPPRDEKIWCFLIYPYFYIPVGSLGSIPGEGAVSMSEAACFYAIQEVVAC